jgi:hypothetical protein
MKIKRAALMVVLVIAVAALTVPLIGTRAIASKSGANATAALASAKANASAMRTASATRAAAAEPARNLTAQSSGNNKIPAETLKALGIRRVSKDKLKNATNVGASAITKVPHSTIQPLPGNHRVSVAGQQSKIQGPPLVGQPVVLNDNAALSAALITTLGGRDTQFSEVALIADWDGREDCVADRGVKIDDFSGVEPDIDFSLTRAAISEHTRGNGHPFFNVYYYGDSVGNVYIGIDVAGDATVDIVFAFNVPELVGTGASGGFALNNPVAGDFSDDQVSVSGIAVNPVADLGDFDPALCSTTGEVIYISVFDPEGGASNAANQPIRTRIFAFGLFEGSDAGGGFVALTNVNQLLRNSLGHVAGVTVDDDGSLYFTLADLVTVNPSTGTGSVGAAIFKATELKHDQVCCDSTNRINRVIPFIPNGLVPNPDDSESCIKPQSPSGGGSLVNGGATFGLATATPIFGTGGAVKLTNYSGTTTTFGNIVSIVAGGCNVIYAAVAASNLGSSNAQRFTQGLFAVSTTLFPAGLPSMIITFADCGGDFDMCSGIAEVTIDPPPQDIGGILPIADGFADPIPGLVINWRVFVEGNGPAIVRGPVGTSNTATPPTVAKDDFQVDFTLHAGIAVNQENTVFFISGGTPAGIGSNPSPFLGEILCYEDACPADRRADFVDLRADGPAFGQPPQDPVGNANVGDGLSTRFDHLFYQSPLDHITFTPTGLSGLATGFLRYTNRLVGTNPAAVPLGPGVTLGTTDQVLADDDFAGPIIFERLDPSHQVAGGDDQNTPNRGDDDDGLGSPTVPGPLSGGFEFLFGGPVGTPDCVWNGLFWNSNGNVTFGDGDTDFQPTAVTFRIGLPKIAPAWADLNPGTRVIGGNLGTFPVLALGFANINAFKLRWINVPQQNSFLKPTCPATDFADCMSSNTFSVLLYDDGTGVDENSNKLLDPADPTGDNVDPAFDLKEGATDLRFSVVVNAAGAPVAGASPVGCPPRGEGTGQFIFDYCRMDLLGTPCQPVLVGYSIGFLDATNPPGICGGNLSCLAAAADLAPFGIIPGCAVGDTIASICPCLIGEGTEPTIFELFNTGHEGSINAGGFITPAFASFDLRFEGNGDCSPDRQTDANRGRVGFFGIGCAPPPNPLCRQVLATPTAFTPGSGTDLVDALCAVPINIIGCGFFPNEVTTICVGVNPATGPGSPQRAGKTVTTAVALTCDFNGDGVIDATVALASVVPVNKHLITATIPTVAIGSVGASGTSTAFAAACCGGTGSLIVTTTFTAGENNIFGPFTRTVTCALALGTRAPVVFSVTPSTGVCNGVQDLLISGACFCGTNGLGNITDVTLVPISGPCTTTLHSIGFVVLNCNLLDAAFNITSACAGTKYAVFVTGPGGTSRNLAALQPGQTCNVLGNEFGVQVTFTCNTSGGPGSGNTPDIATISACKLGRDEVSGAFFLDVTGNNIKDGASVTVGGQVPKKIQFKDLVAGTTNTFTRVRLKKKICKLLTGSSTIVITNPGGSQNASQGFLCTEKCPTN